MSRYASLLITAAGRCLPIHRQVCQRFTGQTRSIPFRRCSLAPRDKIRQRHRNCVIGRRPLANHEIVLNLDSPKAAPFLEGTRQRSWTELICSLAKE